MFNTKGLKQAFLAHLTCVEESGVSYVFHPTLSLSYICIAVLQQDVTSVI